MLSGFHPDLPNVDHDDVARTLVRDLERAESAPKPWGILSSGVAGFFSLGVLPILLWNDRFRDFVDVERQQLRRFAEWIRLHSTRPETMDLRVAGDDLGCRPILSALSLLSVLGVVLLFAAQLAGGSGPIVERLLANTYRFNASAYRWHFPLNDMRQQLFAAWSIGLSIAYLFHWVQVQAHASDVRRVAVQANRVFQGIGVARVPVPRAGIELGLLWIALGVLLASKGAWWGLAMAICGATQQRFMGSHSPRLRRALAARVREMSRMPMTPGRDGYADNLAGASRRRCPHVRCQAPMPTGARFCPRCGHNVMESA